MCVAENSDQDYLLLQNEVQRIREIIDQQHVQFLQVIDQEKNQLLIQIEDYLQLIGSK